MAEDNARSSPHHPPPGFALASIHGEGGGPLRICLLVRASASDTGERFVLLRELPGSRVYLGAVSDAEGRIQEWVEIWAQALDLRDLAFSSYQERLANGVFDQRWSSEYAAHRATRPHLLIVTGMETTNPQPLLIGEGTAASAPFVPVERSPWSLCKDDQLLSSFGLPPYTTSPFRYLHQPGDAEPKTFLATTPDAPSNAHVQGIERLVTTPGAGAVFNPHAGLIRVTRFSPLAMEDYLRILEGETWHEVGAAPVRLFPETVYAKLQAWSATPRSFPFLLHRGNHDTACLNEVFFLKLSALLGMFTEVKAYVKTQQLPLLNVTPSSFNVNLEAVGEPFPALWTAKPVLVKPGQAYPLRIKSTEQRYFIRLGKTRPSPFLPEGLSAHSFGIGSIRMRSVRNETDGVVLEGTLVAEDYLGWDAQDLLWFKLPLGEERLEFYAHVYTAEAIGPREARFRTVPAKLPDSVLALLKPVAGTAFPRAPYEIWPLLSSPCDLYSLGVIAVRALLVNNEGNLPVVLDEVLSLSRHLGKDAQDASDFSARLKALLEREPRLLDLVSPHALVASSGAPTQARAKVCPEIWLDTIALVLRLFPGAGPHAYCQSFGDVSSLALETVFEAPREALETLVCRCRSILTPSLIANEEIVSVLLEQLAAG